MVELILRTSKRGVLWPTCWYKDLVDSLTRKGARNDPRVKCPDMSAALEPLIQPRGGRYVPRTESPLSPHDDTSIRVIRVQRVPRGGESIAIRDATMPDTTGWLKHGVPFFGTIGNSLYEAQTKLNREALRAVLSPDQLVPSLRVAFTLSAERRDRDLDNLYDGLVPLFNRLYPAVEDLLLVKTEPLREPGEIVHVLIGAGVVANLVANKS